MQLSTFLSLTKSTRMEQHNIDAARLVLVDGMRVIDAARQLEIKRQVVERAVARIENAMRAAQKVPKNWVCLEICVPPDKVGAVKEIVQQARSAVGLEA